MSNSETDDHILLLRDQGRLLADIAVFGRPVVGLLSPLDSARALLGSILRRGQLLTVMPVGAMVSLLAGTVEGQDCTGDKDMNPRETRYPCWHEMGWWIPEGC